MRPHIKEKDGVLSRIMIHCFCYRLQSGNGKEVRSMEIFASFFVAVMAGVICHYIIKWLDGDE